MHPESNNTTNLNTLGSNTTNAPNLGALEGNNLENYTTSTIDSEIATAEKDIEALNRAIENKYEWKKNQMFDGIDRNKDTYNLDNRQVELMKKLIKGELHKKGLNGFNMNKPISDRLTIYSPYKEDKYLAKALIEGKNEGSRKETDYNNLQNDREFRKKQLAELKMKRVEHLSNIEANKQKYTEEAKALKKAGINNPYFMTKSGLIGSGVSTNLSSYGDQARQDKHREKENPTLFEEMLKILQIVLGTGKDIKELITPGNTGKKY